MKKWIVCTTVLSFCLAFGQQPIGTIAFEVASIKPAKPLPMGMVRIGMSADAGMLRYTNVSLRDCIRVAYRVKEFQVQGPEWLGRERFDIVAKIPDGVSQDQVPEMLQALLKERFKLALHHDTKEHAIYALVAAKNGPKLKPAENPTAGGASGSEAPRAGVPPRENMTITRSPEGARLKAPSVTLSAFVEMISRFCERPVVDMSGIQGQYDFELVFTPETTPRMPGGRRLMAPPPGAEPPAGEAPAERAGSIHDALQRYGLKLDSRKAPMEILAVDHIEKVPTEN